MRLRPLAALALLVACKTASPSSDLQNEASVGKVAAPAGSEARRLENASPMIAVSEDQLDLHEDYAWWSESEKRQYSQLSINRKIYDMIGAAKEQIVASWFLFDCMIAVDKEGRVVTPVEDVTAKITELLIAKRRANPNIRIAILLDPLNRAYADRLAPRVEQLVNNGIDVFYSDLVPTPPAVRQVASGADAAKTKALLELHDLHRRGHTYDQLADNYLRPVVQSVMESEVAGQITSYTGIDDAIRGLKKGEPLVLGGRKLALDGKPIDLDVIYNAALLKANHRKILVADDGAGDWEALVSSSNPHNASLPSANYGISVKGPMAQFIYQAVRADVMHSIDRWQAFSDRKDDKNAVRWAMFSAKNVFPDDASFVDAALPEISINEPTGKTTAQAQFVTESQIKKAILEILAQVRADDEVRLQMFYLADPEVVEAVVTAGRVVKNPIKIILDPNLHAFNSIKDGTPNRQVAAYLKSKADAGESKIAIRWYETHGEQNHAKIISVTSPSRRILTTGSANWTGKNIGGPNMEANLVVHGSTKLNDKYNRIFDRLWSNSDAGRLYTVDFGTAPHNQPADDGRKWRLGEASGIVTW